MRASLFKILIVVFVFVTGNSVDSAARSNDQLRLKYLRHDGVNRSYHVYKPERFGTLKKPPLILALHGGGGRAHKFSRMDKGQILRAADEHGCVVVFPQGIKRRWNDGRVEIYERMFRPIDPPDDVGFISDLIDQLEKDYDIDTDNVFVTGISNGGFMSFRLALELSDKIKAIAPVTAQVSKFLDDRKPEHPVSLLLINGTEDPLVPYNGGNVSLGKKNHRGEIISTEETIDKFRRFNGCRGEAVEKKFDDVTQQDETTTTEYRYSKCKDGTEVILLEVMGGGHTWPGGVQYFSERLVGRVSRDFNASELIVDFFMNQK